MSAEETSGKPSDSEQAFLATAYQDGSDPADVLYLGRRCWRSSCEPKAAGKRGASTGPAPGNELKIAKSGCAAACSIWQSSVVMPSRVTINRTRELTMATEDWTTAASRIAGIA